MNTKTALAGLDATTMTIDPQRFAHSREVNDEIEKREEEVKQFKQLLDQASKRHHFEHADKLSERIGTLQKQVDQLKEVRRQFLKKEAAGTCKESPSVTDAHPTSQAA